MQFCKQCSNMYYIRLKEEQSNALVYYCRKCGDVENTISMDNFMVMNYDSKKKEYENMINPYLKYDPTLPTSNTMICPSPICSKDVSQENKVTYMRFDEENMKYICICNYCDNMWKN